MDRGNILCQCRDSTKKSMTFSSVNTSLKESNTHNNSKKFIIKVKSNGFIDLAIKNITVTKKICANQPINKSGKIQVNIVNFGKKDAPKSTTCIKCIKESSGQNFTTNLSKKCPSYLSGKVKTKHIKAGKSILLMAF